MGALASAASPDVAALKTALRARLSALVNDDAFMDVLVQALTPSPSPSPSPILALALAWP